MLITASKAAGFGNLFPAFFGPVWPLAGVQLLEGDLLISPRVREDGVAYASRVREESKFECRRVDKPHSVIGLDVWF